MKRSEIVEHIKGELEDMLETIEVRPRAKPYMPNRYANEILDMIEGFGIFKEWCPEIREVENMKATLEFSLPEEQDEFETYRQAMSYRLVIEELDRRLRSMSKHGDKEIIGIEEVRTMLYDLLHSEGIEV